MGLFDVFKKKSPEKCSECVERNEASATDRPQQNSATQQSASSTIWLPTIYEQFSGKANIDPIYGQKIPDLIKTYKSLFNNQAAQEDIQKAFVNLMNEVIKTVYIVPFHYDAQNEFDNDRVIHCTPKAANKFNIESIIYRCQNMTMEQMSKLAWVKDNTTNMLTVDYDWWDISRISGSDGYRFTEQRFPGTMYPYIGDNGKDAFFLCFTGIDQCLKIYGKEKNLHIALFTINDIVEYMISANNMRGMIINPDTETHCFIGKEAF